jgi:hypothetical protein
MPHFVLVCVDKPGALALRMATRQAHFDWLAEHPGVVRLGGPFLNAAGEMAGSLIIFEAADLAAARAFADADPYAKSGLFTSVELRPWRATVGAVP